MLPDCKSWISTPDDSHVVRRVRMGYLTRCIKYLTLLFLYLTPFAGRSSATSQSSRKTSKREPTCATANVFFNWMVAKPNKWAGNPGEQNCPIGSSMIMLPQTWLMHDSLSHAVTEQYYLETVSQQDRIAYTSRRKETVIFFSKSNVQRVDLGEVTAVHLGGHGL